MSDFPGIGSLEVSWHLFDEPDIPDMLRRVGALEKLFEKFEVRPVKVQTDETFEPKEKIFEARYELLKYQVKPGDGKFPEAYKAFHGEPDGFVDFLTGFPYDDVEIMAVVYEESSLKNLKPWAQKAMKDDATPPIPESLFEGPPPIDIIHNYTAIPSPNVEHMADNLKGEKEPKLLWWTRQAIYQYTHDLIPFKRPIPGEFVALAVRLMPGKYWGEQATSPFFFSGNWLDTLYYTSAIVEEVLEPNDKRPYPLYKIRWRRKLDDDSEEGHLHLARPSGFETYAVGDRVAVLKDAGTERKSQTWKDDQEFKPAIWRLAPITFYEQEEANT